MAMVEVDEAYLYRLEWIKAGYEKRGRTIDELKATIKTLQDERDSAEFRIEYELEPRIKQEQRSYDCWVTTQTGETQCENFYDGVDSLCDMVENEPQFFDWENVHGDLYEQILYLIKNKDSTVIHNLKNDND